MKHRKVTLILAALLVLVGAGGVFAYTSSSSASASARVSVLAATGDLAPGTAVAALGTDQLATITVDADSVPAGALASLTSVTGLKSVTTIFKGQILIRAQFSENNATGGLPIPPGKNALSVELGDPQRVAGFVQPGSNVAVYTSTNDGAASVLLPSALVIAVGPTTAVTKGQTPPLAEGTTNSAMSATIVTFALNSPDSAKLVGAQSNGSLYLGLLPSASTS